MTLPPPKISMEFLTHLRCPSCGMTGDACWDDTAAPGGPRGRFNRLVGLSEGFKSIDVGRNQPIQIMCVPCNADVPIPPAPEKS